MSAGLRGADRTGLMRRAVFLDRDGILLGCAPHEAATRSVILARGAHGALRELKANGFLLMIVSNQPGVARGCFPLDALAPVERRIQELLAPGRCGAYAVSRSQVCCGRRHVTGRSISRARG
jgi:HAD superfamily hydrolase (TIGR01662 family)